MCNIYIRKLAITRIAYSCHVIYWFRSWEQIHHRRIADCLLTVGVGCWRDGCRYCCCHSCWQLAVRWSNCEQIKVEHNYANECASPRHGAQMGVWESSRRASAELDFTGPHCICSYAAAVFIVVHFIKSVGRTGYHTHTHMHICAHVRWLKFKFECLNCRLVWSPIVTDAFSLTHNK